MSLKRGGKKRGKCSYVNTAGRRCTGTDNCIYTHIHTRTHHACTHTHTHTHTYASAHTQTLYRLLGQYATSRNGWRAKWHKASHWSTSCTDVNITCWRCEKSQTAVTQHWRGGAPRSHCAVSLGTGHSVGAWRRLELIICDNADTARNATGLSHWLPHCC